MKWSKIHLSHDYEYEYEYDHEPPDLKASG